MPFYTNYSRFKRAPLALKRAKRGRYSGTRRRGRTAAARTVNKGEMKYLNIANDTETEITVAGLFTLLNGIAQGAGIQQRIGTRVWCTSLDLQILFKVQPPAPLCATEYFPIVRCMVLVDTQPNKAVFAIADVLDTTTAVNPTLAYRNIEYSHRFKMLYDKKIILNKRATAVGFTSVEENQLDTYRLVKIHKTFKKPVTTSYNGTGTTISQINDNSMYLCCFADQVASGTPTTAKMWRSKVIGRLRFRG